MLQKYDLLLAELQDINRLHAIGALLSWDQQIHLPRRAQQERGEQLSLVSRLAHERFTSNAMEDLLGSLADAVDELSPQAAVNVNETRRVFERQKRLPARLVDEMSRAFSRGYDAWMEAKCTADFSVFAPCLQENVKLQREVAEHYGYQENPYDALLDGSEAGMTAGQLTSIFGGLKERVATLLEVVRSSERFATKIELNGHYPKHQQSAFVASIVSKLGFDSDSGRIDNATHPFTTQLGLHDVRIASWYISDPFASIRAALHETGHGLYRQGFDALYHGTPMGHIASTGIDEAQARFWENIVGRSRAFCEFLLPEFVSAFPDGDHDLNVDRVFQHVNLVRPGVSRVNADEVTYNLHIILRFEIELGLLNDQFRAEDLPSLWNERMRDYIGIEPESNSDGVLQDPHWSDSMFGYFPTYTLGNVYAAQIHAALRREFVDFEQLIARGEFLPIRDWLRENIYRHGMRYRPAELIERVTGSAPSDKAFVDYLYHKYDSGE